MKKTLKALPLSIQSMADACLSSNNTASWPLNDSYCPAHFDRISCWPPTQAGVQHRISCPPSMFPHADPSAFATRLCTNESRWEKRSHYELCIGCSTADPSDTNSTQMFSLPETYIRTRRYFILGANGLSIAFLVLGMVILLGNSRLRQCSRNILHVNLFLVFLIRSVVQLIAELHMSKGYFPHNVFQRVDACNRTTIYFREDQLLDCKLFIVFMNYINSSVSHWFVFCEALYLFRLLRANGCKDQVQWYIITGWCIPLVLTVVTYTIRFIVKQDLRTCWFEPSIYDWIVHSPNVLLQFLNFIIFNYVCILLARKLNENYRTAAASDHRRLAKYSRLTRSTLILLPLFSVHYFVFMWNTKPLLISHLILVHLTVHTISSSLQGFMVALIYTLVNCEVQRELLRSTDRWMMRHRSSWRQPEFFRNYMNKLDNERLYSCAYQTRTSIPIHSCSALPSGVFQQSRCTNGYRFSADLPHCQVLMNPTTSDVSLANYSRRPNKIERNRSH